MAYWQIVPQEALHLFKVRFSSHFSKNCFRHEWKHSCLHRRMLDHQRQSLWNPHEGLVLSMVLHWAFVLEQRFVVCSSKVEINVSFMIVQVSYKGSVLHEWLEQAEKEVSKIVPAAKCFCSNSVFTVGRAARGAENLGHKKLLGWEMNSFQKETRNLPSLVYGSFLEVK